MALPEQNFSTLQQLLNYINIYFVPNGRKEIDGTEGNNILNSLGNFIPEYTNNAVSGADVHSVGGVVALSRPFTIFSGSLPTSVTWGNNIQKEYYVVNSFSQVIPLNGIVYYDNNLAAKNSIPAKATLHIAQAENGSWIQVSVPNASDVPPVGGGGNGQGNLF